VLVAAGQSVGQTVHLEIFGEQKEPRGGDHPGNGAPRSRGASAPPSKVRR
jgi:hypothetical protein